MVVYEDCNIIPVILRFIIYRTRNCLSIGGFHFNCYKKISSFYGRKSIGAILGSFCSDSSLFKGSPQNTDLKPANYYQTAREDSKQDIGKTKIPPRGLLFLAVLGTFIFSNSLQWWGWCRFDDG